MIVQKAPAPEGTGAADGSEKPPASVAGLSGSLVIWLPMRLDVCGADDAEGTALPLDENSAAGTAARQGWIQAGAQGGHVTSECGWAAA